MKRMLILLNKSHKVQQSQVDQAASLGYELIEAEVDLRATLSDLKGDEDLSSLARQVLALDYDALLLPVGSPLFAVCLGVEAQKCRHNKPMFFSHTLRKSVEKTLSDGKVEKTFVFDHVGFHRLIDGAIEFLPLNG